MVREHDVGDVLLEELGEAGNGPRLHVNLLGGHDDVAHELALIGVAERLVVGELAHLADVVQERAREQQVPVCHGVVVRHPVGEPHDREDVLREPAPPGVVDTLRGRRNREALRDVRVIQKREQELLHMRVLDALDQLANLSHVAGAIFAGGRGRGTLGAFHRGGRLDLLGRLGRGRDRDRKLRRVNGLGVEALEALNHHLRLAVERNHVSVKEHVVAEHEGPLELVHLVEHPRIHFTGAVAERQGQKRLAAARSEARLLGDLEDRAQALLLAQVLGVDLSDGLGILRRGKRGIRSRRRRGRDIGFRGAHRRGTLPLHRRLRRDEVPKSRLSGRAPLAGWQAR